MPELRQNYFTKEWVIIATERAKRPEDLATHRPTKAPAPHVENCPFCPGNENKTPPEVLRIPAEGNGEPKSCARYVPDGGLSCRRRAASL